jgi:hypothetical protein
MNKLSVKFFIVFLFMFFLIIGAANAQIIHKDPDKKLFGKTSGIKNDSKIKAPKSASRTKKNQQANDRKLKRDYDKSVKKSQQRTYEIQTPEVKERMKQNKKDYTIRDKEKRKKIKSGSKGAARKYK